VNRWFLPGDLLRKRAVQPPLPRTAPVAISRLTLHAAHPRSLADPALAALIRACAEETAEHQGVLAPSVELFEDRIELSAELPAPILMAITTELRRATGRWYRSKYGSQLWQGD
jgi:hypothetical protein